MCRKGRYLHLTHEYALAGNTFQIHILKARLCILTSSLLEMPLRAPHASQHSAGALAEHSAPIPAPAEILPSQLQSHGQRKESQHGQMEAGEPWERRKIHSQHSLLPPPLYFGPSLLTAASARYQKPFPSFCWLMCFSIKHCRACQETEMESTEVPSKQ